MTAQNIQFRGIRHTPSDITGQDGDLLDCVNLVHEDGELKPIAMPERSGINVPVRSNRPYILTHIHNTTDGEMFVFVWKQDNGDDMLVVQDANNNLMLSKVDKNSIGQSVKWVESVGNTLVIGTDKSIHYALYKNGEYKWLGDSLPRPVIDFQLEYGDLITQKDPTPSTRFRTESSLSPGMFLCVEKDDWQGPVLEANMSSQNWYYHNDGDNNISSKSVRENLLSKITSIISKAKQNNQFIFPFFVRYAIRLYDGSCVCHSNPILLLPSSDKTPIMATVNAYARDWGSGSAVLHNNESGNTWECVCNTYAYGMSSKLKYYVKKFILIDNTFVDNMDDWSDVVKGVDIFCSSQIPTIDFEKFSTDIFTSPIVGNKIQFPQSSWGNPPSSWLGYMYNNSKNSIRDKIMSEYSAPGNRISFLQIPSLNNEDYLDKISKTNIFYLAKSYKLNQYKQMIDGSGVYYDEEAQTNALGSLESAKTLPDDYISRSRVAAETGHTYNKRLILGNINAELPKWYPILEQGGDGTQRNLQLYFEIEKNGKTIYVEAAQNKVSYYRFGHYIYYPDPDCKRVIVYTTPPVGGHNLYTINMQEHENLNGAYAIMNDLVSLGESMDNGDFENASERPTASSDRYYPMRNAIAMTEVVNPFSLQAANFKEVGNGNVIDLAPNMMEVSSGQWGQYPLYVFTTDGIYAFGINQDGSFGTMSPVSSDVLLHPKGLGKPTLIQTNQALVFLTSRGVMGLSGTKVDLLSQVLDGRHFNVKSELGQDVIYDNGAFRSLMNEALPLISFHDFVKDGFLAYDYKHNKVVVLNNDCKYQYVLSLDNGLWERQVIYHNLGAVQMSNTIAQQTSQRGSSNRVIRAIDVVRMSAAINNYTEMYLQGSDNKLYKTNNVSDENVENSLYQYGYFVTRPLRFGTDEFKTITRLLHRYTHYAGNSFARLAMYGSRDGVRYARLNTLRGMSWRYYIFVVYTYLKPNERYSYMTVDFEPRLTNKLR